MFAYDDGSFKGDTLILLVMSTMIKAMMDLMNNDLG